MQRTFDFDTKEFTVDALLSKFKKGGLFIPEYQRRFIWSEKNKSSFIESIILGLPIPIMFLGECEDGRLEIIDGVQRITTLAAFEMDLIKIGDVPKLNELKGFKFSDLSPTQKRRYFNRYLRIVVLKNSTSDEIRQDVFSRMNSSGIKVNDSEFRHGTYPGPFTDFIGRCADDPLFMRLCHAQDSKRGHHERFELVLRFFAYSSDYLLLKNNVSTFLDQYLMKNQNSFNELAFSDSFKRMCEFVNECFPNGFAKGEVAKAVRFEAISVGVGLALNIKPDLAHQTIEWLESPEFDELTMSDASNSTVELRKRIEYVRDQLLGYNENA
jgi:hypothetical protein